MLSMLMCLQNLVKFCPLVLKILSRNEVLTSIKGCNSVTNLRNLTIYNTNVDIFNDNVHTKFGYILSIGSQDIERKRNSDKGRNSVANLRNLTLYNHNLDIIYANVYTKFG